MIYRIANEAVTSSSSQTKNKNGRCNKNKVTFANI